MSVSAPHAFSHLVDLAAEITGGFVLFATDDYFAGKENLLHPHAPVWLEGKYTDKGKWMDGWESQRRRTPGHDFAIVRLGLPGSVHAVLADTTHFKGNAPQQVAVEGISAAWNATAEQLQHSADWRPLINAIDVKPDHPNLLKLAVPSARVTHVRLRIYPDGGVARLRVWGEVLPEARTFWRGGSVDLAAVENGGTVAEVSDQFFGPPSNLLLPGRGVNMGDGWETKRRRTPGSDWAVIRLARRGVVDRVELDTHFFKGNAPQACLLETIDASELPEAELPALLRAPKGWTPLIEKHPLVQHRRHQLDPSRLTPATHVRVHIFPHGGVNRLRLYGFALDTAAELAALAKLEPLDARAASKLFLSFCGSQGWAEALQLRRPFSSVRALFALADDAWWSLSQKDWLEAFAAHPAIGATKKAKSANTKSAAWSKGEQHQVGASDADVKRQLKDLNAAYFKRFGFLYIACATGRSGAELLDALEERIRGSKRSELENAAREQAKITRLRIEKWLASEGA